MLDPQVPLVRQPGATRLAVLLSVLLLAGCGGPPVGTGDGGSTTDGGSSDGGSTDGGIATPPPPGTIAAVDVAAEAMPYLTGNTVQHYCSCLAGAAAGCVAGDDAKGDGSTAHPYRTLDAAMAWVTGGKGRTAALCRGGSFAPGNPAGGQVYTLTKTGCPSGTICNEVREYPIGGTGPKPIITNAPGKHSLFATRNGTRGWRFLNLRLRGTWSQGGNWGFFLYANLTLAPEAVSDITIENVDMDHFDLAVDVAVNQDARITLTGNHIDDSSAFATLGACNHLTISDNAFHDNGSDTMFDHTIYLGSHHPVTDVAVVGNDIEGFAKSSGNTVCLGGPLVSHGEFTNLTVSGNVIEEDASAGPGCWGLSLTPGGYPWPAFFRKAVITGNVIVNGGNVPLTVSDAPGVVVANNLIIQQSPGNGGRGIVVPGYRARTVGQGGLGYAELEGAIAGTDLTVTAVTKGTIKAGMTLLGTGVAANTTIVSGSGNAWVVSSAQTVASTSLTAEMCVPGQPTQCQDDVETGAQVVNNTIYAGVDASNGMVPGIRVDTEGKDHVVANNALVYEASGHARQSVECFGFALTPRADHYAYIDHNSCFANDPSATWELTTHDPLATWQQTGFDTHSTFADPGWSFPTPLTIPAWDDAKTGAVLFAPLFRPRGAPLAGAGDPTHAPATDITGAKRPAAPSIGAYEP